MRCLFLLALMVVVVNASYAGIDPVTNFGVAEVSTGYDAAATSITLATGTGALFPAPATDGAFNVTWFNYTDYPDVISDPNKEIVRVTARSTDVLTITRAQEGTSAATHNTGGKTYRVVLGVTKVLVDGIRSDIALKAPLKANADSLKGVLIDSTGRAVAGKRFVPAYDPTTATYKHYWSPNLDTAGYGTAVATPAGKVLTVQSDGDIGIGTYTVTRQLYTTTGLWTKPTGLVAVKVICIGGGGGGASVTAADESGGGGGGGSATVSIFAAASLAASESVYVATAAAALANGGSSWFGGSTQAGGQLDIAVGGLTGGVSGNSTTVGVGGAGGAGGTSTTGDLNIRGQNGFTGCCYSTSRSCGGPGGGSALGYGGGGVEGCNAVGAAAGATMFGAGGGGAGTGDGTDYAGGTGGPGLVIVEEYKIP